MVPEPLLPPAAAIASDRAGADGGTTSAFVRALLAVPEPNDAAAEHAIEHHARLTKPRGSLGRLEDLGARLSAIAGVVPPPVPAPAAVAVFAADHGVVAEGVTPWPQEVTAQMVANIVTGGAAVNALARQAGASVTVIDVGVAADLHDLDLGPRDGDPLGGDPATTRLLHRKVRAGTANLADGPALTPAEVLAALEVGAEVAADLVAGGARALVTGEMGIGNTTASAAVIAALLGVPAARVTGRGTGIDDAVLGRKVDVVDRAVARLGLQPSPYDVLAAVGGLEIAALAGFVVGGVAAGVPVVVDGVIAGAALLVAASAHPGVVHGCVAGHRSVEPGATAVLDHVGLTPVLDLGLRLGEGSGACLALGVLEAAARVMGEMATFDSAGVVDKAGAARPA